MALLRPALLLVHGAFARAPVAAQAGVRAAAVSRPANVCAPRFRARWFGGGGGGRRRGCRTRPGMGAAPGAGHDDVREPWARSTGDIAQQDSLFPGAEARRARLNAALVDAHGPDALDFLQQGDVFAGSSAMRMYDAFVYPRSRGALEASDKPSRARVIANQIAFQARELRAHRAAWLRNRDASVAETRARAGPPHPLTLVLDNVRSAENAGNIFRLAECARLAEVVTTGITPAPPHPRLLKTAMGTAEFVPHRHLPSAVAAAAVLRAEGVRICAAETVEGSTSLFDAESPALASGLCPPVAVFLGNEVAGVDVRVLEGADTIVQLPTFGVKNSLNVATAASVLVYEMLRRWGAVR